MFFASDNAGPAHPKVLEALTIANTGYASGYGADAIMDEVRDGIRTVFEAPRAEAFLVTTGTAANSLILATMSKPWQTVFCSDVAHIHEDECNAPEFFSGGSKLTLVPSPSAKLTPDALRSAILGEENRGVHGPQRGPVSITQATEKGTIYSLEELTAVTAVAKDFGLKTHLDGARFANALVRLGCTPAEMTWKAGIDAVSFGGTKNGLLGVEAVVLFDPETAWEFELRRKRGAHLLSKHRYLSAQMRAYLADDLWLDMARMANARTDRLVAGLRNTSGIEFLFEPEANIIFFSATRGLHRKLHDGGAVYYIMSGELDGDDPEEMLTGRLVCDWSMTEDGVDEFLALFDR
ncbi:threonine aldolase family protein [Flavimaricola marinus]|uniref:Low specificity L-threonine aldolase n=1 Tax=Flavimaricola marinus TaxID=1819565 RepID=A0A238LAL8_9RHOB|nr:beta-eliminating lyase-related protein [Flavimaricola marinus]SMY05950.1 Low specificity L-threonine aldolase [Flavimaricola marinus]